MVSSHFTSPYGAFALKATYQRNLALANLVVIGSLGLLLLAVAMWPDSVVVDPTEAAPVPTDTMVVNLQPQGMDSPKPDLSPASPPKAVDAAGFIPVPVEESEFDDRDNVTIPTSDELEAIISDGTFEGDLNGVVIDTGAVDAIPGRGEFQMVEVYPKLISQYHGDYPRLPEQMGLEGTVVVEVLVDEEGRPMKAALGRTSGVEGLDEAALEWAMKCAFSPGIQNNRPVKVWVSFKYEFELER